MLNRRKSSLDILYNGSEDNASLVDENMGNYYISNHTIELKINGRLKHTMKASEKHFMESVTFPSGRVLRYHG